MGIVLQDIRYSVRLMARNPGFTVAALMTLALGIGANTAIFTVVNTVLITPLPFKEPDRLVMVWNRGAQAAGGDRTPLAVADLLDWRTQQSSCEDVGGFQNIFYTESSLIRSRSGRTRLAFAWPSARKLAMS